MPALEQSSLTQEALYWEYMGNDQYGEPVVSSVPIVLSPRTNPRSNGIRWVTKRSHTTDPKGNVVAIEAEVTATFPLVINSQIWLGSIDFWNENKPDQEVCIVLDSNVTPDIKGRNSLKVYNVRKKHNI
jgi:hypothetical protein